MNKNFIIFFIMTTTLGLAGAGDTITPEAGNTTIPKLETGDTITPRKETSDTISIHQVILNMTISMQL